MRWILRISGSNWTPLDNTSVHPDDYVIATEVTRRHPEFHQFWSSNIPHATVDISPEKERFICQLLMLSDPRESITPLRVTQLGDASFIEVIDYSTLKGLVVRGTVRNITSFGAFVNLSSVGIRDEGLLHISEYPVGVDDPHYYMMNAEVNVKVIDVQEDNSPQSQNFRKYRIKLTTRF